ncbi:MAG: DsbE family thiol:disulfide interchange protein [Gammaproteobacteria bacterium]|nr:DsbE family thiol:disulfide interchange protein [Gammaproteobacteria bacterium]
MRFLVPIAIFAVLVVVLGVGLKLDPRYVPSPLIDKPAPEFSLTTLGEEPKPMTRADLLGRPVVLNVWASWCSACRIEHPLLVSLAQAQGVEIIGLNYKDTRAEALRWLADHGDPYRQSIFDPEGKLGLDLGVYGVPETFVLDGAGVIRHKHVGPLSEDIWASDFAPLLKKLSASDGTGASGG